MFTVCGSRGNNLAVLGAVKARHWADHGVVTGYRHWRAGPWPRWKKKGWRVTVVRPDASGHVDAGALVQAVGSKTALVTAMHVNNESGSILDVAALAKAVKEKKQPHGRTHRRRTGVGQSPAAAERNGHRQLCGVGHKIHA